MKAKINIAGSLTSGRDYEVLHVEGNNITIIDDGGTEIGYGIHNFGQTINEVSIVDNPFAFELNVNKSFGKQVEDKPFLPEGLKTEWDMIEYVLVIHGVSEVNRGEVKAQFKKAVIEAVIEFAPSQSTTLSNAKQYFNEKFEGHEV